MMSRLQERFPPEDMAILQTMEVFNPTKLPSDATDLATYGEDAIAKLCEHYGTSKNVEGVVHKPLVDTAAAMLEWDWFKYIFHRHRHVGDMRAVWARLLQDNLVPDNIKFLVSARLVMALNTGCCERGFSRM